MQPVVVEQLVKSYRNGKTEVKALRGISFSVNSGEIFGLIGPDGAGKTSLFKILVTLSLADGGKAFVDGLDVVTDYRKIRSRVGYMPGHFSLYQDLSVQENLQFFATIFDSSIEKNYALVKDIYRQLEPFNHRRAGQLSGGMKQKLALCCALIHRPKVLFLDEPTTGVDAVSRKEFWEMLHRLKLEGITILVSTAYMDEAALCDRVALIQQGQLLTINTPQGIVDQFKKTLWAVKASRMYDLLICLRTNPEVESCYSFGQYHHVLLKKTDPDGIRLRQLLQAGGFRDVSVRSIKAGIEDCFMDLMKAGK